MLTCAVAQTHSFLSPLSKAAVRGNSIYRELFAKCAPLMTPREARFQDGLGWTLQIPLCNVYINALSVSRGASKGWTFAWECCKAGRSLNSLSLWVSNFLYGKQIEKNLRVSLRGLQLGPISMLLTQGGDLRDRA